MAHWTTADIPDLTGRTAVVTGANSGLGFETAQALAGAGARVVMACRDETKGRAALDRIGQKFPGTDIRLQLLDLADLSSIRNFAANSPSIDDGLDILVNNAGVMAIPRRETADGFEMQFGTNHLGHFALTALLLDRLLTRPGARVVTISSEAAMLGRIKFDDLQGTRHYGAWRAYGQAKLANQLFTLELHRRATKAGAALLSVAAHPGYAATNLQAVGPQMSGSSIMEKATELGNMLIAQPASAGALPSLFAATSPEVRSGQYFGPDRFFGMRGHPTTASFVRTAQDPEAARRLWEISEELTGVRFDRFQSTSSRPG